MEPNLIEVAQLVKQEDRRKIRIAKLKEITKAGDDLFFILAGAEVFKKSSKFDDYSSFEKSMRQSIEKARHRHRREGPTTVPPPGDLLNQLKELLSVDYTPPQAGGDMGGDLIALANYYRSNFFVPSIEMILDLSLCKLIGAVNKLCAIAIQKGERELPRTKKSSQKQKNNAQKKREYIVEILPHVKNKVTKERKTLSTMALAIKNDWKNFPPKDKDIKKPPGLTLISETLKKSGKFERIGGLWNLKM